jgi:MerR family transcriptional regulator, light-induced transcriptional regulator
MELPRLAELSDIPLYNMQTVARKTHVQASRLRTWERRYTFLSPHRDINRYRLYSDRDIAIICWLRDQVESGMTIHQATTLLCEASQIAQKPTTPIAETKQLQRLAQDLFQAAYQFDESAAVSILSQALATCTVEDVCLQVMASALKIVGDHWRFGDRFIAVEHFLSGIVRAQLNAIFRATPRPSMSHHIIVASGPDELHGLGGLMFALLLRRAGLQVSYFGPNLAARALYDVASESRPSYIALSVTMAENLSATLQIAEMLLTIPDQIVLLGGSAIQTLEEGEIPNGIHLCKDDGLQTVAMIKTRWLESCRRPYREMEQEVS